MGQRPVDHQPFFHLPEGGAFAPTSGLSLLYNSPNKLALNRRGFTYPP